MNSTLTPLVSVICTTYNHENYIRECLEGFIIQKTEFLVEIIVHDDASTDNTVSIIQEFETAHPDLFTCIYQKENQYSKKNVNIWSDITFPLARGKYIAVCEGDDYWTDPLKLQKQVDFLEANNNYSMCFTHQLVVSSNGATQFKNEYENKGYSTLEITKGFIPGTQTMVFRNFYCLQAMLNKFKSLPCGDRMLAYSCSLLGDLYLLPEFTAAYRQTGAGVWTSIPKERQYFFSIEEFINFHIIIGLPVNNELIHAKINGSLPFLWKSDKKKFLKNIRHVLKIRKKYSIENHFFLYILRKIFF